MSAETPRPSDAAHQVLKYAEEEARRFNHHYIGTEHLLAGLLRGEDTPVKLALQRIGIDLNKVRSATEFIIGRGERIVSETTS